MLINTYPEISENTQSKEVVQKHTKLKKMDKRWVKDLLLIEYWLLL